jgi:adenosine deaminase
MPRIADPRELRETPGRKKNAATSAGTATRSTAAATIAASRARASARRRAKGKRLADLHLHFEGSVPRETLVAIARRNEHAFGVEGAFERALANSRRSGSFLRLFADCCRLFSSPADYAEAAGALGRKLAAELAHAEIYVSPEIWSRFGLDRAAVLAAIDAALGSVEEETGCRFVLLLDSVRQWGPDAARRVLDLHEESGLARVRGFGIGGEEDSVPPSAFAAVYERAKRLGLGTSIHAGEWAGPASVAAALDALPLDRIDHGVRAAEDPSLVARLAGSSVTLCAAPSSNLATGVYESWKEHPLPRLLDAGVRICLSADDPTIFSTSTSAEYDIARKMLGIGDEAFEKMRTAAWDARFAR